MFLYVIIGKYLYVTHTIMETINHETGERTPLESFDLNRDWADVSEEDFENMDRRNATVKKQIAAMIAADPEAGENPDMIIDHYYDEWGSDIGSTPGVEWGWDHGGWNPGGWTRD